MSATDIKIIGVQIESYLRIRRLKVDKLGNWTVFKGKNGSGKSSGFAALTDALIKGTNDPSKIHGSADKGEVIVELSNGYKVHYKQTRKSSSLDVFDGEEKVSSPRKVLATLLGTETIVDPTWWYQLKETEQLAYIIQMLKPGLAKDWLVEQLGDLAEVFDFDKVDFDRDNGFEVLTEIQERVKDARHNVGVERDQLAKAIEQDKKDLPDDLDTKRFQGYDPAAKRKELSAMQAAIREDQHNRNKFNSMQSEQDQLDGTIKEIEAEIERLTKKKAEAETRKSELYEASIALEAKIDKFKTPDVDSLERELADYDRYIENAGMAKSIERRRKELDEKEERRSQLDTLYKELVNKIPNALLGTIEIPIEGMTITPDGVFIGGQPASRRSSGQRISDGLDLVMFDLQRKGASARFVFMDNFDALDEEARKVVAERTNNGEDLQLITTEITNDPDVTAEVVH